MKNLGDGPFRGKIERDIILGELRCAGAVNIVIEEDEKRMLDPASPAAMMARAGVIVPSLESAGLYVTETVFKVSGKLRGWTLERAWYYWVVGCDKPENEIGANDAMVLHKKYGQELRVGGHCGCPRPQIQWLSIDGGMAGYHVDSQEAFNVFCTYLKERGLKYDAARAEAMKKDDYNFKPCNDGYLAMENDAIKFVK